MRSNFFDDAANGSAQAPPDDRLREAIQGRGEILNCRNDDLATTAALDEWIPGAALCAAPE